MTLSYTELQNNYEKLQQEMLQLTSSLKAKDEKIKFQDHQIKVQNDQIKSQDDQIKFQESKIIDLERMLAWFQRQLFGAKTERRLMTEADFKELPLFAHLVTPETPPAIEEPPLKVAEYERRQRKSKIVFVSEDSKLKFTADVPVKTIELPNPELEGLSEGVDYKVIDENVTYKLAQTKSPYCVLKYVQKVVTIKSNNKITKPALPTPVIEKSLADVSFLSALVVEKYSYHLPLYRQHQRLTQSGVHISRSTLTKLVHRVGELLEPIQKALLSSVLQSSILTIDETPLKAGRSKGKMKQCYFWPLYGEAEEVVFLFSSSRSRKLLDDALSCYKGIILCDGYSAYNSFQVKVAPDRVQLAQCWIHCRRKFLEAEAVNPKLATPVLDLIGKLYHLESLMVEAPLEARLESRQKHSAPIVKEIIEYVCNALQQEPLVPSDRFAMAARYLLKRRAELSLFLTHPDLPLDTNHIEREIRAVAVGRKNWLFCFTEVGAHISGILYSLIASCKLAEVDPYDYLVDVLQRISIHPIMDIHLLTPRLWKVHFENQKLTSDLL